jgi:hypothetical protein
MQGRLRRVAGRRAGLFLFGFDPPTGYGTFAGARDGGTRVVFSTLVKAWATPSDSMFAERHATRLRRVNPRPVPGHEFTRSLLVYRYTIGTHEANAKVHSGDFEDRKKHM